MGKNWWILPASILAFIAYKKFALAKSFSVFFKGIDLSDYRILTPVVNIMVQVNNPTYTTAEVQNITGDLYYNDQFVGSVKGITPSTLGYGANIIKIPVVISYTGISDMITNFNTSGVKLAFKGSITVDYISLPLNFDYTL